MSENVVRPSHYTFGNPEFEPITVMKSIHGIDSNSFYLGNALKYLARCDRKNQKIDDLKKAKFYISLAAQNWEDVDRTPKSRSEEIGNSNTFANLIDDWKLSENLSGALQEICNFLDSGETWCLINAQKLIEFELDEQTPTEVPRKKGFFDFLRKKNNE